MTRTPILLLMEAYGHPPAARLRSGVTLVELLIVLTLVGVLAMITVPGMESAVRELRLNNAAHAYAADLRLARIEAIKRNRSISVTRTGVNEYTITTIGNRRLADEAEFIAGSAAGISFASFGPAIPGSARFIVGIGDGRRTVEVNAAGFARVR